jgi:hypothetical protein
MDQAIIELLPELHLCNLAWCKGYLNLIGVEQRLSRSSKKRRRSNASLSIPESLSGLKFSGKSIDEIAAHLGLERSAVVQYYRDTGRRSGNSNSGTSVFLRHKGAHGSVIAATLGIAENRSMEDDPEETMFETETNATGSPLGDKQDTEGDFVLDALTCQPSPEAEAPNKYSPAEKEVLYNVETAINGESFIKGQHVRIKENAVSDGPLVQYLGETMSVVSVLEDMAFIELLGQDSEGNTITKGECMIPTSDIELSSTVKPWEEGDDAIYQSGSVTSPCVIIAVYRRNDGEPVYAVKLSSDGERIMVKESELQRVGRPLSGTQSIVGKVFTFTEQGCSVNGTITPNGGMLVLAGSIGRAVRQKSANPQIVANRLTMLEEGYAEISGRNFVVLKDFAFTSLTAAGSAMSGVSSGGHNLWRDANGDTYKQLMEQMAV